MRLINILFLLFAIFSVQNSFATKMCKLLSKSEFITDVAQQSDLVALVTVKELSPEHNDQWTKASVDEIILNKKNESGKVITINKWRANYEPLFTYHTGDKLVLWLRKVGSDYELTNSNWNECVPSVWSVNGGNITPQFSNNVDRLDNVENIKQFIHDINR